MIRETFPVGLLHCNCSILGDETTREAIVVDPGDNVPEILTRLSRRKLKLKQIIVTHGHIDHVGGAVLLKRATGAPILLNEFDLPLLEMMAGQAGWLGVATPEVAAPDVSARDGMIIGLSGAAEGSASALQGKVLHTPGHTEGSICLHFSQHKLLLAGDTLFAGSIGRTDLPGGDPTKIIESIHDRLLPLEDDTVVVCGHGVSTTIGSERNSNPFLS
ncbi:MAG TPA: MBL fold metallo-hydrolase [Acidisarcina sp.]